MLALGLVRGFEIEGEDVDQDQEWILALGPERYACVVLPASICVGMRMLVYTDV